jgi:endonuclease VIII
VPEGDTIFRAARALHHALAGGIVTRFESVFPALTRIADDRPIIGRTIESAASRGKHVLIAFSGDLVLRTHMRMSGSWHLYPPDAPWKRPARDMRVLVATEAAVAVGFNVPIAELLTARGLERHRELRALGPDPLGPAFDRHEAVNRMRARGAEAIGDVLLNQRVIAGIGNVFKSEILFLAGVDPFTPVARIDDDRLAAVASIAREQLAANVLPPSRTLSPAFGRRTTRSLDPRETLWVYGRGGRPCRRCGAPIRVKKTGLDARLSYWCPRCQPPSDEQVTD